MVSNVQGQVRQLRRKWIHEYDATTRVFFTQQQQMRAYIVQAHAAIKMPCNKDARLAFLSQSLGMHQLGVLDLWFSYATHRLVVFDGTKGMIRRLLYKTAILHHGHRGHVAAQDGAASRECEWERKRQPLV